MPLPLRKLLFVFDTYDFDRAKQGLLATLSELEIEDEDAPVLPELFIGSLIYAYADPDNEDLRDRLRELAETVEEDVAAEVAEVAEEAPATEEKPTPKKKGSGKSRVGAMFDLLTFSDI